MHYTNYQKRICLTFVDDYFDELSRHQLASANRVAALTSRDGIL